MPPALFPSASRALRPALPSPRPPHPTTLPFCSTRPQQRQYRKPAFRSRLCAALAATPLVWRPIPIGIGIAFLGAFQLYRIRERERRREQETEDWRREQGLDNELDRGDLGQPRKRQRIRPSGPWTVQIMSTIPLKALSRWWGWFNSIDIPYYLRVPGFKLYGYIFGVNFDEIYEPDLHKFRNLSEFFYRTLKPSARPLDPAPNALLSPADGKVVQFGIIEHGEVEQVKGVTYNVDALLGTEPTAGASARSNIAGSEHTPHPFANRSRQGDAEIIRADEEFARVNGISYTLPNLLSGTDAPDKGRSWWKIRKTGDADAKNADSKDSKGSSSSNPQLDQSTRVSSQSEREVAADLSLSPAANRPWYYPKDKEMPTALYYCVVYLAPGDYHRFHSPVSWVVESRRHFAGELYSVSPYLVRTLPGLFTLNERVVLLGRWKYGFFSYTPVGATNVGSIVINFDRELRTNSLLTDTLADKAAEEAAERGQPYSAYTEATYTSASPVLGGHALRRGEEMGGFQLGSTIVMVFEAPKGIRPSFDEGFVGDTPERKGGFRWNIERGKKVKVGEALGYVEEEEGS